MKRVVSVFAQERCMVRSRHAGSVDCVHCASNEQPRLYLQTQEWNEVVSFRTVDSRLDSDSFSIVVIAEVRALPSDESNLALPQFLRSDTYGIQNRVLFAAPAILARRQGCLGGEG
jgi:hypothetical protein